MTALFLLQLHTYATTFLLLLQLYTTITHIGTRPNNKNIKYSERDSRSSIYHDAFGGVNTREKQQILFIHRWVRLWYNNAMPQSYGEISWGICQCFQILQNILVSMIHWQCPTTQRWWCHHCGLRLLVWLCLESCCLDLYSGVVGDCVAVVHVGKITPWGLCRMM